MRVVMFAAIVVAAIIIGSVAISEARSDDPRRAAVASGSAASKIEAEPSLAFRAMSRDASYGRLSWTPLDEPAGAKQVTPLECAVIDVAKQGGICLVSDFSLLEPYRALLFDAALQVRHEVRLEGGPSRTRLAPNGAIASATVFVSGHSYAVEGFSTATTLMDTESGEVLANLEEFATEKDGSPFSNVDFNFWGVTFDHDSDHFFATLGTQGKTYLVEGTVSSRSMRVVRENVECPSLSPDATRVAYKKRVGGGPSVVWRLHVLDLRSGTDTPLAESRSIDDQVEWLDDRRVLYTAPSDDPASLDVFVVPADGSGQPELFRASASSPSVVR